MTTKRDSAEEYRRELESLGADDDTPERDAQIRAAERAVTERVIRAALDGYGSPLADDQTPDEAIERLTEGHHSGDTLRDFVLLELSENGCAGNLPEVKDEAAHLLQTAIDQLVAARNAVLSLE